MKTITCLAVITECLCNSWYQHLQQIILIIRFRIQVAVLTYCCRFITEGTGECKSTVLWTQELFWQSICDAFTDYLLSKL